MTRRISSPVCVGRDEELEALEAALKRAADGQLQGVLVAGDSGVGKTRLLHEFRQSTEPAGTPWVWGECIELAEGELPYAPIVAALQRVWREAEDQILTRRSLLLWTTKGPVAWKSAVFTRHGAGNSLSVEIGEGSKAEEEGRCQPEDRTTRLVTRA